jgi:thymidylate synthase (FAD)
MEVNCRKERFLGEFILREEVLDHGFVELQDVMPHSMSASCQECGGKGTPKEPIEEWIKAQEPYSIRSNYYYCITCGGTGKVKSTRDLAIVNAARTSYLGESKGIEQDKKLLRYLYINRHTTPFEQVVFKFRIKAPIIVWWQWVRHRTWSYNLQSGRYTEYDDEFYVPTEWRLQDNKNRQGSDGLLDDDSSYELSETLKSFSNTAFDLYNMALEEGVAKEQARLFLPSFILYHEGVATVDAHNLLSFLRLRTDEHAQWEIRQYALAIEKMFAKILPWTYEIYKETQNG